MYPSDLSDAEWEKIEPVFRVDYRRGGRPLKYSKRQITTANLSDKQGAREMLGTFYLPCVQKIWVDQGYDGLLLYAFCKDKGIDLEVVKRKEEGFKILPKRWIVERTLGWMSRYRRLSKDYEGILPTSQNWCYLSMIRLMIKRVEFSNFRF